MAFGESVVFEAEILQGVDEAAMEYLHRRARIPKGKGEPAPRTVTLESADDKWLVLWQEATGEFDIYVGGKGNVGRRILAFMQRACATGAWSEIAEDEFEPGFWVSTADQDKACEFIEAFREEFGVYEMSYTDHPPHTRNRYRTLIL